MKRFLTVLLILFAVGVSFEMLAADTFDASSVTGVSASAVADEAADSEAISASQELQAGPFAYFVQSLKDMAASSLANDLGFQPVHGQPLPGVLLTLLLGAAFGLARRKRGARHTMQDEQSAAAPLLIAARLFRLNILFLNPPDTIHTISPGPDLFCLRE